MVTPRRRPRAPVIPAIGAGSWLAAGNRFIKLTRPPVIPIGRYTGRATGIPLNGGQAQGFIPAGFALTSGSIGSPGAFATVVQVTVAVPGTYTVAWTVSLAGTLGAGDANNMVLFKNSTLLATAVCPAVAGSYPQAAQAVTFAAGDTIGIGTVGAGTAGSTYGGQVSTLSGAPLTLTAGPQGLGNIWYPAQVTLSTTTGPLDTSTALVYLGSGGVPTELVGSVYSGNGTVAVAIPPMQPGDLIIVTWTGGHAGDTAAFNTVGVMDALTTGAG